MDHEWQLAQPYPPSRLSGYFDAFVENMKSTQDACNWTLTLISLQNQKSYLEDLLSKTATTLNALRDRQTRNERALSTNPTPRSKRKKILQNRWRTDKTIKTCENEEKVILDCLEVCHSNMKTLEALIYPTEPCFTLADGNWSSNRSYMTVDDTFETGVEWDTGWTDQGGTVSPFDKPASHGPVFTDDIAPESPVGESWMMNAAPSTNMPANIPPHPFETLAAIPLPPLDAAPLQFHSGLSPEAVSFEPTMDCDASSTEERLDRLSLSGLLASKRGQRVQSGRLERKRRLAEAAISPLFACPTEYGPEMEHETEHEDEHVSAGPARRGVSCGPTPRPSEEEWEVPAALMKRTQSL
jgi:hypothetical protein